MAAPDFSITNVFVLMLENRSLDHLLGFSQLQGVDALTGQPTTIAGLDVSRDWNAKTDEQPVHVFSPADWTMPDDPGHEFPDVREQLCGINGTYPHINNSGFVTNYAKLDPGQPDEIMKCYVPEQLPILTTLAREFAVCDHWFSSMPGPTWPNRGGHLHLSDYVEKDAVQPIEVALQIQAEPVERKNWINGKLAGKVQ